MLFTSQKHLRQLLILTGVILPQGWAMHLQRNTKITNNYILDSTGLSWDSKY